mgnify:FL=1
MVKMKKFVALLLCPMLLLSSLSAAADSERAENISQSAEKTNNPIEIAITVQERNGIAVQDFFFRRGVALEKGQVYSAEDICLKENGRVITSSAESLQKYDDGSICWLLVSGVTDLNADECKTLVITNGASAKSEAKFEQDSVRTTVTTDKFCLVFGPLGIESIKYEEREQLNGIPVNLYATVNNKTYYLTVTEITELKNTSAYSKFKLKGRLNNEICGEMYVTIPRGAARIQVDHRITVENNFYIQSTGLTVGAAYNGAEVGSVVDSDWLDLGGMQLSSYDNTRFDGATNVASATGYVIGENYINFAPIVNGKEYYYYDGFSRTAHLYIGFGGDAQQWAKTLAKPPAVRVDNEQYVRAGQIMTTHMSALAKKCMESFKFGYSKSIGIFNAGILPYEINSELGMVGRFGTMPGEIEYNFGVCWMQSGDEEMYRHMFDLSEVRADLCAYRGGRPDIYGCLRGATTTDTYRFNMAHSYYGDQGGLYMTYVLSGDEWVWDTFKMSLAKTLSDMYLHQSLDGSRAFLYRSWSLDTASPTGVSPEYHESRGMIRARTYYLAAQILEDDRYLQAMKDLLHWSKAAQRPDGSYPHFIYNDGGKYFDSVTSEEIVKDYVMLYGVRGISQLLDFTDNKDALDITLKVADYLCYQRENFGDVLWYPNSDASVYRLNDGGGRGPSPMTTSLAIDVLCTAFERSGNERYLVTLADFLTAFLGMEIGGIGAEDYGAEEIAPRGDRLKVGESPRGSSLLRCSDNLSKIFDDNRERLMELGYESTLLIFDEKAKPAEKGELVKYEFPDVIHNVYENGSEKAVFLRNMCAKDNDPNGDWSKTTQLLYKENRLWQGVKNIIKDNRSVTLEKFLKQSEGYSAIQRPIYAEQFKGEAVAEVVSYDSDKIEIEFEGDFDIGLKIADGKFRILDNRGYTVTRSYSGGKVHLQIVSGGSAKPVNGNLEILFNGKGRAIPYVGAEFVNAAGIGDKDPGMPLSKDELRTLMKKLFSVDAAFNDENPTWDQFSRVLVPAIQANNSDVLRNSGLTAAFDINAAAAVSDEQAVRYAADALSVDYNGESLSSDVYLASESLFDTKVQWKCSREDIISPDGTLNRKNADCDSVTLTATVTKNAAVAERTFNIPLKKKTVPTATQGPGFTDETAFPLVTQTKEFEITYTAVPFEKGIDSTMSFTSSSIGTRTNADLPYIVRFNPNGVIDMYNSYTYTKGVIPYEVNKKYCFRVVIRPEEMTYDAYVTPEGGEELVIGENCGARQSAPVVDKIDKMWTWASVANVYKVYDVSLILEDDAKSESIGNGFSDENGLIFGRYRINEKGILPSVSDDGFIINWAEAGSYGNDNIMTMYAGMGQERSASKTLTALLRDAGLLDSSVSEESSVTPASLSRILTALGKVN